MLCLLPYYGFSEQCFLKLSVKKNGATTVNFLRLLLGFIFLSIFTLFSRGFLLPIDADLHSWLWLLLSGIVGFAIGDFFCLSP